MIQRAQNMQYPKMYKKETGYIDLENSTHPAGKERSTSQIRKDNTENRLRLKQSRPKEVQTSLRIKENSKGTCPILKHKLRTPEERLLL